MLLETLALDISSSDSSISQISRHNNIRARVLAHQKAIGVVGTWCPVIGAFIPESHARAAHIVQRRWFGHEAHLQTDVLVLLCLASTPFFFFGSFSF